jgi:hypothetical protein
VLTNKVQHVSLAPRCGINRLDLTRVAPQAHELSGDNNEKSQGAGIDSKNPPLPT